MTSNSTLEKPDMRVCRLPDMQRKILGRNIVATDKMANKVGGGWVGGWGFWMGWAVGHAAQDSGLQHRGYGQDGITGWGTEEGGCESDGLGRLPDTQRKILGHNNVATDKMANKVGGQVVWMGVGGVIPMGGGLVMEVAVVQALLPHGKQGG